MAFLILALAGVQPEPPESPYMPKGVDHLVFAVPDLDTGIKEIERLLGVKPIPGGRHPDFGTHNALVALGKTTYLEIIAPDPELPRPERGRPFGLDEREESHLATWALRSESIKERASQAKSQGVALGAVTSGSRDRPDGRTLSWKLTDPYAMPMDGAVPFLISWGLTPHPAGGNPKAGKLTGLRIVHPNPTAVRDALGTLGVEMKVEKGPQMQLVATIQTGNRQIEIK